jgi:hypothetical protein
VSAPHEPLARAACPVGEIGLAVMRPKAEEWSTADQPQAIETASEPHGEEPPLLLPTPLQLSNGGALRGSGRRPC